MCAGHGHRLHYHGHSVVHRAPAPLGSHVTITATLTAHTGNRVVTDLVARLDDGTIVATCEFTQVILPKDVIRVRFSPDS